MLPDPTRAPTPPAAHPGSPAATAEGEDELARVLGLRDAIGVVIGAIIGVGIFFTPRKVAVLTGSVGLALLAWGLGGVIALLGALTFAELGGLYPRTGGQYEILRDAYGSAVAFVYGFCLVSAIQAGATAIIGIVCAQNLGLALGGAAPDSVTVMGEASLLIAGLTAVNVVGVRSGATIQNLTAFAKVATLVAVSLLALFMGSGGPADAAGPAPIAAGHGPVASLFIALSPILFSFGGWQQGTWMAGEIKDARRAVPTAIVLGVLVVISVYLLSNWAYFRLLGFAGVATSSTPAADAVGSVARGWGARLIAAAVAVSAFGIMNAQLLSGPRYLYAMARDGRFFPLFDHLHPRFGTPARAVILLGTLSLVLLLFAGADGLDKLLNGIVFIDWVFFGLTGAALIVLRHKRPEAERPVRVPGYPVVPALFVLAALAAIAGSFLEESVRSAAVIGLGWIAAAVACFGLFFRSSSRPIGSGRMDH